jgi:DNA-directed RNA polymerase specialized sigma24 family protein
VRLGIATLSPRERLVLALAYFGECTHHEIAAQTGFPLGSVKSLMARSQQKLRTMFAPVAAIGQASAVKTVARQSAGAQLAPTP